MALAVGRRRAEPTSGLGVDALRPLPRKSSAGGRVTAPLQFGEIDARLELLLLGTHQNGFPNSYARSRARGGGDAGRRLAPTRRTGPGPVRGRARPRVSGGHRDNTNTPFLYNNKTSRAPSCRITHAIDVNAVAAKPLTSPRPRASRRRPSRARRRRPPGTKPAARNTRRPAAPRAVSATRASRRRPMVKRTSSRP